MKTVIISQARMTSTRLPGKVLRTVLDKSLLEYQIERLRRVELSDYLIIATTVNPQDDPIVALCEQLGTAYYRGPEEDVLARFYEAATLHSADTVVRVTSDCPLIDPEVVNSVIAFYQARFPEFSYVSNTLQRTFPRGMDTEVFSYQSLEQAFLNGKEKWQREHVTPYIHQNPTRFSLANVAAERDYSHHRWTVDTMEDFSLIKKIIESLYPKNRRFSLQDCLHLLDRLPEWAALNAMVEQKKLK